MNLNLNLRQQDVAKDALRMFAETLAIGQREGFYSAINAKRIEVARALLAVLEGADETQT